MAKSLSSEKYLVLMYFDDTLFHVSLCKTRDGAERSAKESWQCGDPSRKAVIIPASELLHWNDSAVQELERMMRL